MTLRMKTLIIISVTVVGAAALAYVASSFILQRGFAEAERQYVHRNVGRATCALSHDLEHLAAVAHDRAARDCTRAFLEGGNGRYIGKTPTDLSLSDIGVDLVLYIHSSGRVAFGKCLHPKTGKSGPVPGSLLELASGDGSLSQHSNADDSVAGIVVLPESPMLVASQPILASDGKGPIRGTLIVGRYLDSAQTGNVADTTRFATSLTLHRLDDPRMPPDLQSARAALSETSPIHVRPLSPSAIAGYAVLDGIYGEPALILRVDIPRPFYKQSQASTRYLVVSLLLLGVVLAVVTSLLVEKVVLSRLARLSSTVRRIGKSGDLSARVPVAGNDEIASLATDVNHTMAALQKARDELETRIQERTSGLADANRTLRDEVAERKRAEKALQESEQRYRLLAENSTDVICMLGPDMRFTYVSPSVKQLRGLTAAETMAQKLEDIVTPASLQLIRDAVEEDSRAEAAGRGTRVRPRVMEVEVVCKDGPAVWTEVTANRVRDAEGKLVGFQGVVRDVSERKKAEEAIASAYQREHRIADVLQRALVPEVDVDLAGYRIVGDYKPALEEAEVGGDFYDVFQLSDGRMAIVMGDVSGKGLQAAVHTAMAKYMLRAYANENAEPGCVLERLNQAICDHTPDDMFVTVFYGILDPPARTLTYANAGHDEPLLQSSSLGSSVTLDITGRAIGVFPGSSYGQRTLELAPGDVLLVYTDGVTDARSRSDFFGRDGLSAVLAANAEKTEDFILGAVLAAASEVAGGALHDDAAVVVVKAGMGEESADSGK